MFVSIEWLRNHQSDHNLVILDTRPKTMFLYGHLPNSQPLTLEQVIKIDQYGSNLVGDEKQLSSLFGSLGIDDSKTVLVLGDSMDPSAARIAWSLLYLGHKETHILDENISGLRGKGFEFTKKIFHPKTLEFFPKINSEIRIDSKQLNENLKNLTVIDARTPQEFMTGHLPNSKLIPFTEGISFSGKLFQEKDLLQNLFSQNNLSEDSEIVCYCMHGHRASSLFFQLKIAGYSKVKLYDGSFVEWQGRGLPLE
ncbi:MAG: sulfurtransferase [Nitrosopumilaceae archaeon]